MNDRMMVAVNGHHLVKRNGGSLSKAATLSTSSLDSPPPASPENRYPNTSNHQSIEDPATTSLNPSSFTESPRRPYHSPPPFLNSSSVPSFVSQVRVASYHSGPGDRFIPTTDRGYSTETSQRFIIENEMDRDEDGDEKSQAYQRGRAYELFQSHRENSSEPLTVGKEASSDICKRNSTSPGTKQQEVEDHSLVNGDDEGKP